MERMAVPGEQFRDSDTRLAGMYEIKASTVCPMPGELFLNIPGCSSHQETVVQLLLMR